MASLGQCGPLTVSQVAVFIAPTYLLSICQQQGRAQKRGAAFGKPSFTWHPNSVSHLLDRRPGRDQHLAESCLRRSSQPPTRPLPISLSFPFKEWLYFPFLGDFGEMRSCACCMAEWTSGFYLFSAPLNSQGLLFFPEKDTSFFLNSVSGVKWYSSVIQIYLFIWGRKKKSKHKITPKRQEDFCKINFKV